MFHKMVVNEQTPSLKRIIIFSPRSLGSKTSLLSSVPTMAAESSPKLGLFTLAGAAIVVCQVKQSEIIHI